MKIKFVLFSIVFMLTPVLVHAADLTKAKDTVDNIRLPDPPSKSTTTKESPVGIPTREFKPQIKTTPAPAPPSPVDKNNPQNDPDVKKGFEKHQKEHGKYPPKNDGYVKTESVAAPSGTRQPIDCCEAKTCPCKE